MRVHVKDTLVSLYYYIWRPSTEIGDSDLSIFRASSKEVVDKVYKQSVPLSVKIGRVRLNTGDTCDESISLL